MAIITKIFFVLIAAIFMVGCGSKQVVKEEVEVQMSCATNENGQPIQGTCKPLVGTGPDTCAAYSNNAPAYQKCLIAQQKRLEKEAEIAGMGGVAQGDRIPGHGTQAGYGGPGYPGHIVSNKPAIVRMIPSSCDMAPYAVTKSLPQCGGGFR